ncbi:GDSL-type esterase/lipase family protein [Thalassoroseus pseudoceratinae]|uniref:GDSL-type esterase/lipase family protein n=1 Tax=Thalassoroseus pseudoceratinae TaxID=2713176 RepID=UPI001422F882|nr:GDSL-type esterase/lipase family protein [Thalassoroseus pseudoceratinae]
MLLVSSSRMTRLLACLLVCCTTMGASAEELPEPLAKIELSDGDTLVFLGDSITHQCLYTQYVEDFFFTRFPQKNIRFHNAGVGGAKAWDALQRFDRDVADFKPKYVTVLLGMNDGRYQAFNQEIFDTYKADMTEVVEQIKETGAKPVLMTPTMYDARAKLLRDQKPAEEYNAVLAYYGQWLQRQAMMNGFGFVDMHGLLNNLTIEARKSDANFTMIADAVHPGPDGQLVMAYAIINDMGLRKPLSSIRITKGAKGKPVSRVSGGKLTDLQMEDDGLSFTWTADALPWVVPAEAQTGAKMLRLGHKASREALEIHDLPAGSYQLTIDGQVVGVYSAQQLARHVELQGNAKTPQYQQAMQVAELNKQRNAGPVRNMRGEWSRFQRYARTKQQVADAPTDALKQQLDALTKQIEGMDERVKTLNEEIEKLAAEIREVAQPKPRTYRLEKVEAAKVSGLVVLNGEPLAGAIVQFIPDGSAGSVARGKTNAAGNFVAVGGGLPGVLPGMYRVVIKTDGVTPAKFGNAQTTPLRFEVQSGKNKAQFELQK